MKRKKTQGMKLTQPDVAFFLYKGFHAWKWKVFLNFIYPGKGLMEHAPFFSTTDAMLFTHIFTGELSTVTGLSLSSFTAALQHENNGLFALT